MGLAVLVVPLETARVQDSGRWLAIQVKELAGTDDLAVLPRMAHLDHAGHVELLFVIVPGLLCLTPGLDRLMPLPEDQSETGQGQDGGRPQRGGPRWPALHPLQRRFGQPRRLGGADLDTVVGYVLGEGAIVQRGVPMAQFDGQNFDVRVVCVYGRPAAAVFRLSPHPMTNLHLGGRRGNFARCRAAVPARACSTWERARSRSAWDRRSG